MINASEVEWAQIALNAALLRIEGRLPAQVDGHSVHELCWVDVVDFHHAVVRVPDEGQHLFTTSAEAIAAWLDKFLKYVEEHPGNMLFWRVRPEIECYNNFVMETSGWHVYSRFSIADVPEGVEVQ